MIGFSARLRLRHRLWWEIDRGWWKRTRLTALLDRLKQHYTLLGRDDPDTRWKQGMYWQRALSNKWNAREFALRHGLQVPTLYWKGRRLGQLEFEALPTHFVLRPVMGHSRQGIFVFANTLDLLRGRHFTEYQVKMKVRRHLRRYGWIPLMAEEFVKTPEGDYRLPVEYSFHTFAGRIGIVSVKRRTGTGERRTRHYTSEWDPFPPDKVSRGKPDTLLPPPECLDEMIHAARTLGRAYGSYVRIDLFASEKGCVFGEFASTPRKGYGFTPFADEYLGELWDEYCPDRI